MGVPLSVQQIINQVCFEHGVKPFSIYNKIHKDKKHTAALRQIIKRILLEVRIAGATPSLPSIGGWLKRDHTTILHHKRWLENNGQLPKTNNKQSTKQVGDPL